MLTNILPTATLTQTTPLVFSPSSRYPRNDCAPSPNKNLEGICSAGQSSTWKERKNGSCRLVEMTRSMGKQGNWVDRRNGQVRSRLRQPRGGGDSLIDSI